MTLKLKLVLYISFHVSSAHLFKHLNLYHTPHPCSGQIGLFTVPLSLQCITHIVHVVIFMRQNHYIAVCVCS